MKKFWTGIPFSDTPPPISPVGVMRHDSLDLGHPPLGLRKAVVCNPPHVNNSPLSLIMQKVCDVGLDFPGFMQINGSDGPVMF